MSRRGGHGHGPGARGGRQDYTLLRDDANAQDMFDVEEGQPKRRGATVWRLMALAKDEVWVSFPLRSVTIRSLIVWYEGQLCLYGGECRIVLPGSAVPSLMS